MGDQVVKEKSILREAKEQADILAEGCVDVVPREDLERKLAMSLQNGTPLRVKLGIDPTGAHVHIGHAVVYRKIRQFQNFGHTAVLIIGDYTARIGDPTDLNGERPPLSKEEVEYNAATYTDQILKVVSADQAEIRFQSEWFDRFSLEDTIRLNAHFSLAHLMSHETFRKRIADGNRLSLHEIMYPVLQAYDSVQVVADIEIGGSDQTFNCLCGRDLMKAYGLDPQIVMTSPLLPGVDGRKMSKSFGNDISLKAEPDQMFGKIMSISDSLLPLYLHHVQGLSLADVTRTETQIANGDIHPMVVKKSLAHNTVMQYHGAAAAENAREQFDQVFSLRGEPEEMDEYCLDENERGICAVLKTAGVLESTSEARRLITQGGIKVNGEVITDTHFRFVGIDGPWTVKIGKRRFLKILG